MNCIVAVSGGVDSVVLLDLMYRRTNHELIVAHFDHGIREESAADARFVEGLAKQYGVKYVGRREVLGAAASEELARSRRYEFLTGVARKHGGVIITAHHRQDIVETIALNLRRGTGWRGLSVMNRAGVLRPLRSWTKQEILAYATRRRLEWCEDWTNASDQYARNRLRKRIAQTVGVEKQAAVYELWQRQRLLRAEIEKELDRFSSAGLRRYFLTNIDENLAQELLYHYIVRHYGVSLLSSQLDRAVTIVKTGRVGTKWHLGGGLMMKLTSGNVIIDKIV